MRQARVKLKQHTWITEENDARRSKVRQHTRRGARTAARSDDATRSHGTTSNTECSSTTNAPPQCNKSPAAHTTCSHETRKNTKRDATCATATEERLSSGSGVGRRGAFSLIFLSSIYITEAHVYPLPLIFDMHTHHMHTLYGDKSAHGHSRRSRRLAFKARHRVYTH